MGFPGRGDIPGIIIIWVRSANYVDWYEASPLPFHCLLSPANANVAECRVHTGATTTGTPGMRMTRRRGKLTNPCWGIKLLFYRSLSSSRLEFVFLSAEFPCCSRPARSSRTLQRKFGTELKLITTTLSPKTRRWVFNISPLNPVGTGTG